MENLELNEGTLKEEIAKARVAAMIADASEPCAESAYYDPNSDRIVIKLRNKASFLFPPELVQGLEGSSLDDLIQVEVTPSGQGLHWEKLDVYLSIPSLMLGIFGTEAWMVTQVVVKSSGD